MALFCPPCLWSHCLRCPSVRQTEAPSCSSADHTGRVLRVRAFAIILGVLKEFLGGNLRRIDARQVGLFVVVAVETRQEFTFWLASRCMPTHSNKQLISTYPSMTAAPSGESLVMVSQWRPPPPTPTPTPTPKSVITAASDFSIPQQAFCIMRSSDSLNLTRRCL